jgi:very-short-patch-repair endonuclease
MNVDASASLIRLYPPSRIRAALESISATREGAAEYRGFLTWHKAGLFDLQAMGSRLRHPRKYPVPSPLVGEGEGGGSATMPHANVDKRQRSRAKDLRRTMTPAETLLWRYIKAHRIDGLGFRRQVPFRNYIADFVCLSAKLIVELDGTSHDFEAQQQADRRRDDFFSAQGFQVLRFTNQDVMSNLEGVVELIRQTAASRIRGVPPSLTLPHKGGGNSEVAVDDVPEGRGIRS